MLLKRLHWLFVATVPIFLSGAVLVHGESDPQIPQWVKANAKWWAEGQIGDSDFVKGIEYLVQSGIIQIHASHEGNLQNSKHIPSWIKTSAGWWANGSVGDSDFVKGINYLIDAGIIEVGHEQVANETGSMMPQNQTTPNQQQDSLPETCTALDDGVLPDPACTPGKVDPGVTQQNIDSTICVPGYTKTVRPPVSYTEPLKFKLMDAYGFNDSPSRYELDHLIPLEIGGSPTSVGNLWPEPHYTDPNSYDKDGFENYLHEQVCSGNMDLKTAQDEISSNWVKYWEEAGSP